jgi:hypothetical protein
MALALNEKSAIKAEGEGQSGSLFEPDNAGSGFFVRALKGWGYFCVLLRYSLLIWAHQTTQLAPCHTQK